MGVLGLKKNHKRSTFFERSTKFYRPLAAVTVTKSEGGSGGDGGAVVLTLALTIADVTLVPAVEKSLGLAPLR